MCNLHTGLQVAFVLHVQLVNQGTVPYPGGGLMRDVKNKAVLCKPLTLTKATYCKPHMQSKHLQTGERRSTASCLPPTISMFFFHGSNALDLCLQTSTTAWRGSMFPYPSLYPSSSPFPWTCTPRSPPPHFLYLYRWVVFFFFFYFSQQGFRPSTKFAALNFFVRPLLAHNWWPHTTTSVGRAITVCGLPWFTSLLARCYTKHPWSGLMMLTINWLLINC